MTRQKAISRNRKQTWRGWHGNAGFTGRAETGRQVLLSFPTTTPAEIADVTATMEQLKSMSKTVTIQGAASEVMNLGLYLSGVDLAAEGEVERIDQLADRLEHMSEGRL